MSKMFGSGSFLGFVGPNCRIDLTFKSTDKQLLRKATVRAKGDDPNGTKELPLYTTKDTVVGEVRVSPIPGKKVDHMGVTVQLIGRIEVSAERGNHYDFLSLSRELISPGELSKIEDAGFEFSNVEMQYDSYRGKQACCRYLLRVTLRAKGISQNVVKDFPFWVRNYDMTTIHDTNTIKMEVGIEECLHIEFEYERNWYHLKDVVVGRINFLLVRIKLKYMEIELRRRETAKVGSNPRNESEIIGKYEIMDGAPVRGESVPIRMYLTPFDLTPSFENVHNKFSVKYFLNLVLVDEEDRRYFKQQEIHLYRKKDAEKAPVTT